LDIAGGLVGQDHCDRSGRRVAAGRGEHGDLEGMVGIPGREAVEEQAADHGHACGPTELMRGGERP